MSVIVIISASRSIQRYSQPWAPLGLWGETPPVCCRTCDATTAPLPSAALSMKMKIQKEFMRSKYDKRGDIKKTCFSFKQQFTLWREWLLHNEKNMLEAKIISPAKKKYRNMAEIYS